eukprot:7355133-Prymnesium_polylepis.1
MVKEHGWGLGARLGTGHGGARRAGARERDESTVEPKCSMARSAAAAQLPISYTPHASRDPRCEREERRCDVVHPHATCLVQSTSRGDVDGSQYRRRRRDRTADRRPAARERRPSQIGGCC